MKPLAGGLWSSCRECVATLAPSHSLPSAPPLPVSALRSPACCLSSLRPLLPHRVSSLCAMPSAATPLTGLGSILAPEPVSLPSHARVASTAAPAPFAVTEDSSSSSPAAGTSGGAVRRRANFQYDLSDIDRAHSISYVSRLHKDPRCPLDPVYTLASIVERPVTPPRFVRDALDCSDIERARPTLPPHRSQAQPRSIGTLSTDIVGGGARPLARYPPVRKMQSSSLESRDITNTRFVSSRCTDPLDPVYSFGRSTNLDVSSLVSAITRSNGLEQQAGNTTGNLISFGAVDGAKARKLPAAREAHNASLSLRSEDISSPAAQEWSWAKPRRTTWRDTTNTRDVPGAQTGADRSKMSKTTRHIDPNTRNYEATLLGGSRVGDNDGMVHVHRHVLDGSPHAATWKPSQGEPAPDAAGISMWRSGNFTAGMLAPKMPGASVAAPAAAVAPVAAAAVPAPKVKQPFGAPAEDGWIKESAAPAPVVRAATPVRAFTPATAAPAVAFAPSVASYAAFNPAASSAAAPSSSFVPASTAPVQVRSSVAPNLSYPADARRAPPPQKRHVSSASVVRSNLLSHPPSNGRETEPIRPDARIQPLTFGVRGPFAVPTERASIEESQAASTISAASTAAGVMVAQARSQSNSRGGSRPSSRNQLQPAAAERPASSSGLSMTAFSPTASTLSNAFSMAFVPTSTGALPASLPFSSPVSRPGLGTIELFERNVGGPARPIDVLARTQERKMQTMRAEEIQQVRLLA